MEDGGGDTGVMQIGGGHLTRGHDWGLCYWVLFIKNMESRICRIEHYKIPSDNILVII